MITDENGQKWPETVEDEVQLRKEQEQAQRREEFWNRKAKREGWERKPADQKNLSPLDLRFAQKKRREGTGSQN